MLMQTSKLKSWLKKLSQPLQPQSGYLCLALLVSPLGTLVLAPLLLLKLYEGSTLSESLMLTIYAPFFALLCIYLIFFFSIFPLVLITQIALKYLKILNIITILLSYLGFSYGLGFMLSAKLALQNLPAVLLISTPMVIFYIFLLFKFTAPQIKSHDD